VCFTQILTAIQQASPGKAQPQAGKDTGKDEDEFFGKSQARTHRHALGPPESVAHATTDTGSREDLAKLRLQEETHAHITRTHNITVCMHRSTTFVVM